MMTKLDSVQYNVVALVVPGSSLFETSIAAEVFGQPCPAPVAKSRWYRFRIATPLPGSVKLDLANLDVEHGLRLLHNAHTIVIPGWPSKAIVTLELARSLRNASKRGARMVSFCTGSFLLAEIGLLDGLTVTTHWGAIDRFRERFPSVQVDPNVLYVDNEQILTSAGSSTAIDLSLHIVSKDFGVHTANAIAREMVTAPHRHGGQAQFATSQPTLTDDPQGIGSIIDWMSSHINQDLPVHEIARQWHMSPRTFSRRFSAIVGEGPHQWLIRQRVKRAQELLEQGHTVEHAASLVGFKSAMAMRPHFKRITSTSANQYRRSFARP
jgi:AraC family transcriptional regulator, transcriptional activator FtrA